MNCLFLLEKIKNHISEVRKDFPDITDDLLVDNGNIYYMNGNDGTDFDWFVNGRMCEFMVFHKENEYGFIKVNANDDGSINTYIWLDNGLADAIVKYKEDFFTKDEALYLASLLYQQADKKNIWDENINNIDLSEELRDANLLIEEEEEEYFEEDDYYEDDEDEDELD